MKLVPQRLRKGKRRREPRFYVVCQPDYQPDGDVWRLHHVDVTVRNDSDLPHRVDEALLRYDDGRVGLAVPMETQLFEDIPAHQAISFQLPAASLLSPGAASRFRIVVSRGKGGRRQEWTSKEELIVRYEPPEVG